MTKTLPGPSGSVLRPSSFVAARPERPARILHVMEATIGGTKRHLLDLAAGLRAGGWDVEVACPRVRTEALGDVSFWDDLRAAGVPAHEVTMRRRPLTAANAAAVWRLAGLIRRGGYAVVHAHSAIAGALARPAAALSGHKPKVVYTPHGFAFLAPGAGGAPGDGAAGAHGGIFLAIERALGRVTDRLIAVSPTEAEAAAAYGVVPRRKIATIPLGIVADEIPSRQRAAEVRRREGWGAAPVVGTLARMSPQKSPLTWLAAAARVAAARPDVQFVWIWSGEMEGEVRARARELGLEPRLAFLGYRPDAREVIAACDVFLLASAFEGLPYSLIEALAAGVPVVATDVVGTRDVVRHGETGLLAAAGDAGGLAAHVLRLLGEPAEARRLAAAGRADVLARFSVAQMVARTAALYEALLRPKRAAGRW